MSKRWVAVLHKLLVLSVTVLLGTVTFGNPVLNNIGAGNVSIQQSPGVTTINQASHNAILNWKSFNIPKGQATHFIQPTGGIALNRISPLQGVSQIYGELTATGRIILVNSAGIYFGPSAYVNVGGMIATTANITNKDFLNANYQFMNNSSTEGSIVNDGTIIAADHGLVALVGSDVTNNGLIKADLGNVVLASGDAYTLSFDGNDLINFAITKPSSNPNVTNNGTLIANGGQILVTAAAAQGTLDNIINMNGVAVAHSVGSTTGDIIIDGASDGGVVNVAGDLDATGKQSGQTGGSVQISGNDILVGSSSVIDVSGDAGGGHISIGANPISNATVIQPGATLLAQALVSGNGGLIETSGHYLDINGITVNTSSASGATGTWLLDPTDIYIADNQSDATAAGMTTTDTTANSGTGTTPETFAASGPTEDSLLTTSSLEDALANNNVLVTTNNTSGTGAGNINVVSNVGWSANTSLTLSAANNINIMSGVTIGNASSSTAALNLESGTSNTAGTVNVDPTASINNAGPVNIYYNPATFGTPDTYTNNGAGTLIAYQLINTSAELQTLSTTAADWGENFALGADISAGTLTSTIGNTGTPFTGNFTGNGFNISNLTIDLPSDNDVGLFGMNTGTIQGLAITSGTITGADDVGGLVGLNDGNITTSSNAAAVNGTDDVGGIAGYNDGAITLSYNTGTINDTTEYGGGLVGYNDTTGTIMNSYNLGAVIGIFIGSFVGENNGNINNVYSSGFLDGMNLGEGGIAFGNSGTISNSFFDEDTTGADEAVAFQSGSTGTTSDVYVGSFGTSTVDLSQESTYLGSSSIPLSSPFDFTNTWGIINGASYPYLLAFYPASSATPQVIQGNNVIGGLAEGATEALAVNGTPYDTTVAGENGAFYFFEGNNAISGVNSIIPGGQDLILYTQGNASGGNWVFQTPPTGSQIDFLQLVAGFVSVGDPESDGATNTYSSVDLLNAKGSNTDPGILYSLSGASNNNITLNTNDSIEFFSNTNIDGNVTTTGTGTIAYSGGETTITTPDPVLTTSDGFFTDSPIINGNGNALTIDLASNTATGVIEPGATLIDLSAFTLNGLGTLTVSSANTYTGPTNINGGTLVVNDIDALGSTSAVTVASGANLNVNGNDISISNLSGAGDVQLGAGSLTTTDNTSQTFSGDMSGTGGSYTKEGTGTEIFSGDNTYSGGTIIDDGTLNIQNADGLGTGAVTVNSPATLVIDGVTTANGVPITLNGTTLEGIGNSGVGNGAITLTGGTDVIESATAGDTFTVNGSIDDQSSGTDSLNLDGPGTVNLASTVGSSMPLLEILASGPVELSGSTVATTEDQNYTSSLTLGADITLNALATSLAAVSGDFSLTTNTSNAFGELSNFNGNIDIGSLTVNGSSQFNDSTVQTTGAGGQVYNAVIGFDDPVQLLSGSAPITFNASVGGSTITLQNANNTSTGTVSFLGGLGVDNLVTFASPYAIQILNDTATFGDAQTFLNTGGVTLGNSTSTAINFDGGLDTSAANVVTTIDAFLDDANSNAGFVLGTTLIDGGPSLVTIDSDNNPVSLGLTDGTTSNTDRLEVLAGTGAIALTQNIGSSAPLLLVSLNSSGTSTLSLPHNITTGGSSNEIQIDNGGAISQTGGVLNADVMVTNTVGGLSLPDDNSISEFQAADTGGGNVSLQDTVPLDITGVTTTGNVTLDNTSTVTQVTDISGALLTVSSVGGTTLNLGNTVSSFNATNTGSGDIQFTNTASPLTITGISQSGTGSVSITNTGDMSTSGALSSASGDIDLTTLNVGAAASFLTINNDITTTGGSIDLDAANITSPPADVGTATALVINPGVTLSTGTGTGGVLTFEGGTNNQGTITVGAGSITLNGNGLDITQGTGVFNSSVSFLAPRFVIIDGNLSSDAGDNIVLQGDTTNTGVGGVYVEGGSSVTSGGTLLIEGVSLAGNTVGADTTAGIDLEGNVSATGAVTLSEPSGNGNIDVNDGVSGNGVTVTPSGTGAINLGSNVTSTGGAIQFNGPVNVNSAITVNAGDGAITFGNTVDGANVLTLQGTPSDGTVTFDNDVTLAGLDTSNQPYAIVFDGSSNTFTDNVTFQNTGGVTFGNGGVFNFEGGLSNVLGTTTLDGTITASGQAISLDNVNLTGNSDFGLSTSVTINGTLNGADSLTFLGPASVSLDGLVGNTTPLLSIADHASSTTIADNVTTSGDQTYSNPVNITGNVTFDSTGGNVQLQAVTGTGTQNLDINEAGTDSSVGAISDIVNFTKDGAGTLTLNGQNSYTGTTTLNDGSLILGVTNALPSDTDLNLPANTTLNLGAFGQTLDALTGTGDVVTGSGSFLELENTTPNTFGGDISGAGEFLQAGAGTTTLTGDNTYSGPTFIDAGELSIAGAQALSPSTSVDISGGAVLNIDGVAVTNTPGISVDNGSITGTGTSSLTAPISFQDGSTDTLSAITSSDFTVNGDLNGAIALTLDGIGSTLNINGNVGNTEALTSLTTNGTTVSVSGDVTTTGDQTYNAPVNLTNDVTYDATGGAIDFTNTLNGAHNLVLDSSGLTTFADPVGATTPLTSLDVTASNIDINGGSIVTSAGQAYNDPVTLAIATTLTGTTLNLNGGVNGGTDLNLNGDTMSIAGALGLADITVTGQGANNSFVLNSGTTQDWALNGAGSGTITAVSGVTGPFTFTNLQNLTGGAGADDFNLAGGSLTGSINGGAGNNSLTGGNSASSYTLTGPNAGTATGLGGSFTNIENLVGGSSNNTFTLAGGSLAGGLNGGSGTDNTLIGNNIATVWNITGVNSGSMSNVGSFNNIQNLTGGSAGNTFNFANGASLSGTLNGGSGNNAINWSAYGSAVTVTLASDKFSGTAYIGADAITTYSNIDSIVGNNGLLTLTPQELALLTRTGPFSGIIADPLMFSGFFVPGGGGVTPTPQPGLPSVLVYPIIQQPVAVNGEYINTNPLNYDVDTDINANIDQIDYYYIQNLYKVHINPFCGGGNSGNL